jgi:hypothetical protein
MRKLTLAIIALSMTACTENLVEAPKPPEQDAQFVLERKMSTYPNLYVFRDKVNNKLIYMSKRGGIDVVEDTDNNDPVTQ